MNIFRKNYPPYKSKEETPNRREDEIENYEKTESSVWSVLAQLKAEAELIEYAKKARDNSRAASVIPIGEAVDQYAFNDKELTISGDFLYPRSRY